MTLRTPATIIVLLLGLLHMPLQAAASETLTIEHQGQELSCIYQPADSEFVIMILPGAFAPMEAQQAYARELAAGGIANCLSQAFSDLFLAQDSRSYLQIPADGIASLMKQLRRHSGKRPYLLAQGRGAQLTLRVIRASRNFAHFPVHGAILFSPNLLQGSPGAGEDFRYIEEVRQTIGTGLFVYQSQYSPHHWHLEKLLATLRSAGSRVRHQRLPGVRDGYALREDITEPERRLRRQTPQLIRDAVAAIREMR